MKRLRSRSPAGKSGYFVMLIHGDPHGGLGGSDEVQWTQVGSIVDSWADESPVQSAIR